MYKCEICGKEFEKYLSLERHVSCSFGKERNKKHCPLGFYKWKYESDGRFSKDRLREMYFDDGMSTLMMADALQVNKGTLIHLMHFYGFKLRSSSQATKNQLRRDGLWNKGKTKYDHSSIMKYAKSRRGKSNPYYTAPGFEERRKRMIEVCRKAVRNSCRNRNPATTEKRMCKILDAQKLSYVRNFSLSYYDHGKAKWRLFDFLIENVLLVEMHGNYFHANPKFYDADDEIVISKSSRKAKDIWQYDAAKVELGKRRGYQVYVLWEDEFTAMTDKEVLTLIQEQIDV